MYSTLRKCSEGLREDRRGKGGRKEERPHLCSPPPEHLESPHFFVPLWQAGPHDQLWQMSSMQKGHGALRGCQVGTLQSSFPLFMVIGSIPDGTTLQGDVLGAADIQCESGVDLSVWEPLRLGDVCYCGITWLDLTDTLLFPKYSRGKCFVNGEKAEWDMLFCVFTCIVSPPG